MNPNPDKVYNTPQLDKTSKLRPQFYRKPTVGQEETKINPYKFKMNSKPNTNNRGYSCQVQQKSEKVGIDEMIKNSQPYKELLAKMKKLQQQHSTQKQAMINSINSKNETISQLKHQQEQLNAQKANLLQMQANLQQRLQQLRQQNERIREYIEICQNGELDLQVLQYAINTDNMTYEELLELEQKMGTVSKGFTEEQMLLIPQYQYISEGTDELCTICYYQFKKGEVTNLFDCKHRFHHTCISGWLLKQRICPMCKQEIHLPAVEPQ